MYVLSQQAKDLIKKKTGKSIAELSEMTIEDESNLVRQLNGKSLIFSEKYDIRRIGRGNPLLARRRFRTMEYVDNRIEELCKVK